jgi:hypothetical protein
MLLQDETGVTPTALVPNGVTFASVGTEIVGVMVGVGVLVGAAIAVMVRPFAKVATALV